MSIIAKVKFSTHTRARLCVSRKFNFIIIVIFEIKMIKKICLGVIRFEIGQSELDFLTCWNQLTLGAPFSKSGRESCLFLLPWASLCPYLTQNIIGCPGMIFYWIRQMINQAEPSILCTKAIKNCWFRLKTHQKPTKF